MEEDESSLLGEQNFYTCPHFFLKKAERVELLDSFAWIHKRKTNQSKQTKQITSSSMIGNYRKIPKISRGASIFQGPFLRGLFLEGLIYGGKFAF